MFNNEELYVVEFGKKSNQKQFYWASLQDAFSQICIHSYLYSNYNIRIGQVFNGKVQYFYSLNPPYSIKN